MNVLILGDGNSIHVMNFIKVIFSENNCCNITLMDMNTKLQNNSEAYAYYEKKDINLISNNSMIELIGNKYIRKIPKIRSKLYEHKLNEKLEKLGKFDYCLIHYVDQLKARIVYDNKNSYDKIIPIFWGSDLLRNKKINNQSYSKLFKCSEKIIFNTKNMHQHFGAIYGKTFLGKSEIIKFPTLSFETIDSIQKEDSNIDLKSYLNLPLDKHIIICGHAATLAERHKEIIDQVSKISREILDECFFIFPLTYGELSNDIYSLEINKLMTEKNIQGKTLNKYINSSEMLKYIITADIYVTVIKTDAFSSVMQESLYSQSYLIYGNWLNYLEFDDVEIVAKSVEEISDIKTAIEFAITNMDRIKLTLNKNKDIIHSISSPEIIEKLWQNKVFLIKD